MQKFSGITAMMFLSQNEPNTRRRWQQIYDPDIQSLIFLVAVKLDRVYACVYLSSTVTPSFLLGLFVAEWLSWKCKSNNRWVSWISEEKAKAAL